MSGLFALWEGEPSLDLVRPFMDLVSLCSNTTNIVASQEIRNFFIFKIYGNLRYDEVVKNRDNYTFSTKPIIVEAFVTDLGRSEIGGFKNSRWDVGSKQTAPLE
jgi:hypothetical protein